MMSILNKKSGRRLSQACIWAATAATLGLSGCGPSFQSKSTTTASNNQGSGSDNNGSSAADQAWKALQVEGGMDQGRFMGTKTVALDKANKLLVVTLPMPANPFLDGATVNYPMPELPGASLTLEPLTGGGSALVLRVPLDKVLNGVDFLPATGLPNGDPLPAIPDGELPSLAVQLTKIKDIKATIYLGRTIVGIYVNTPFDPFIRLTLPIVNKERTRTWGYLSSIPAKSAMDGGFFISVALPDDIARVIDDHL